MTWVLLYTSVSGIAACWFFVCSPPTHVYRYGRWFKLGFVLMMVLLWPYVMASAAWEIWQERRR